MKKTGKYRSGAEPPDRNAPSAWDVKRRPALAEQCGARRITPDCITNGVRCARGPKNIAVAASRLGSGQREQPSNTSKTRLNRSRTIGLRSPSRWNGSSGTAIRVRPCQRKKRGRAFRSGGGATVRTAGRAFALRSGPSPMSPRLRSTSSAAWIPDLAMSSKTWRCRSDLVSPAERKHSCAEFFGGWRHDARPIRLQAGARTVSQPPA